MSLPASVHRCPGQNRAVPAGEWPFPRQAAECHRCERRRQGIADYMAGAKVEWMQPPTETPCPEILRPKEKRSA